MKISELKQPYRRMAEYLADKNYIEEASNRIYNLYKQGSIMDIFCRTINSGNYPPITKEIKQNFPPDFDFSEEEEAVNTNPFSVDGLSLNQIAVRMFKKNFMDLELWEQGLVNETVEQNDIAKNSIIELPNNPIIQKTIYTQLAREGKFDQLPDTCEFSKAVKLEVCDGGTINQIAKVIGKFKGKFVEKEDISRNGYTFWNFAQLPTPKIDFSQLKSGDVVEVETTTIGYVYGYIRDVESDKLLLSLGYMSDVLRTITREKIKSITKIK